MNKSYLIRLFFILLCWMIGASASAAQICDADNDGDVDRNDISLIFTARNTSVTEPDDPRDADGNGIINVLDARQCAVRCTLENCAEPENRQPTADAGPNQRVAVGDTVTLDGSGSNDLDGDSLTFSWAFKSRPPGSTAQLSDPNAVMPTFIADLPGDYELILVVNDGTLDSEPDDVSIGTENTVPEAVAQGPEKVEVGDTVQLDGSASSDADGDPLTYQWSLTTPPGSDAELSDPNAVAPTFVTDASGNYIARLVVNDGTVDSAPSSITVTTENIAPVAAISAPQSVAIEDSVTLDGSSSSDADDNPLTYRWALTAVPADSTATLSEDTAVATTFVADVAGTYVAQLIVNDGTVDSEPATATISTANPVAVAGPAQTVDVGATVTLDGSASSARDGGPLTYLWELISRPPGSTAELSDPTAVMPTFVADVEGRYEAKLIVNDGTLPSPPDTVDIIANETSPPTPPQLSCGGLVSGTIEAPGETDVFRFTGQAGGAVSITLGETEGFEGAEAARATLFSPTGRQLSSPFDSNGQRSFVLPESGNYTIQVNARDFVSTGSYNLDLQCLQPAGLSVEPLNCGELAQGTISAIAESDAFSFSGEEGGAVSITLGETEGFEGTEAARATLFSPTGRQLSSPFDSNGQRSFVLPESGNYTIQVNARDFASTGSYNVSLDCL